jgi:branched-subunit amino acid ABC-type transport system permease component
MLQRLLKAITPSKGRSLAGAFIRLGWAGFWLQVVFGSLPLFMLAYYLAFSRPDPETRGGFGFIEALTVINLLMLLFTTYWSFRYTRIGRHIRASEQAPAESYLVGTVWTGVVATTVGMLFSMISILIETANLLFYFMKSPQAGVPVIQTSGVASTHWVSAFDMMSLMALVLFLCAEMIVLVFGLWLLFRTTLGTPEPAPSPAPVAEKEVAV